jgi:hypothetical protein
VTTTNKDWLAWHEPYADETSPLSRRLRIIQAHIGAWLDANPGPVSVISGCAGQGHDILGVLGGRPDAGRVRALLVEGDERNVAAARAVARDLDAVTIRHGDAGLVGAYLDALPADLVLMCGVFGNISDDDLHSTIKSLPQLCGPDAVVIWTRSRRDPDLTPTIRSWFADYGFVQEAFDAPDDALFSVGVHRLVNPPAPATAGHVMFRF